MLHSCKTVFIKGVWKLIKHDLLQICSFSLFLFYMCIYIRSICRQQLFHSLRAHQYSSDQMKILKDQSAQTTARVVVSVAYCLWLPFLINRVLNLTIPHPRNGVILYIYCHSALICVPILYLWLLLVETTRAIEI